MKWHFLPVVLLFCLGGCDQRDLRRKSVEEAETFVKAGNFKAAIHAYEGAMDGTPKTADLHYKIAIMYDDKLKEPLRAIHHYERYLESAPQGAYAKQAKAAKADCEKRLQVRLSQGGLMTLSEGVRLRNENESLRKMIAELRSPKKPAAARVADPHAKDPLPPGAKRHTVQKGETLASIALKHYKSRAYAGQIKDANFNQLGGKDMIKPGQVLIIPEITRR